MDDVTRPQRTVPVARPSSPAHQPETAVPAPQPHAATEAPQTAPVIPVTPAPPSSGAQPVFQAETPQPDLMQGTSNDAIVSEQSASAVPPAPNDHAPANAASVPTTATPEPVRKDGPATESHTSNTRHQRKGGRAMVIIFAVVFALALIGGAVYAYMLHQKEVAPVSQPATKTQTSPAPATQDVIDSTTKAIDTALKDLDDTADFSETSLSNTTLGL